MGLFDDVISSITDGTGADDGDAAAESPSDGETTAPARCLHGGNPFVAHFERAGGAWAVIDATAVESGAGDGTTDGASGVRIQGPFDFPRSYTGCPHCGDTGLFHCGACNRLACWDAETSPVVCPWCENRGEIDGPIGSIESYENSSDGAGSDRSSTDVADSSTRDGIGRK